MFYRFRGPKKCKQKRPFRLHSWQLEATVLIVCFFRNQMTCADNTCKNESAVKNDLVNYTHNFTQAVDVSYFLS